VTYRVVEPRCDREPRVPIQKVIAGHIGRTVRTQRVLTNVGGWIVGIEQDRTKGFMFVGYAVRDGDPFVAARRPLSIGVDLRRTSGASVLEVLKNFRLGLPK
jgi:hypothetical protein